MPRKEMDQNQRNLILGLIKLTATDTIIWYDSSDITRKGNFHVYYEGFFFETLFMPEESPKLFIEHNEWGDFMIIDEVPCTLCDLIGAIHSQFNRMGITIMDNRSEEEQEQELTRLNNFIEKALEVIGP